MWIADGWKDYEVIDCSKGEKLERWGRYLLVRPDPQVIWDTPKRHKGWKRMNGHYHRSSRGGGEWEFFDLPEQWTIRYRELTFNLKPFSFKHTGLFPEQATNWDWFGEKIRKAGRPVKVLNLFAYTPEAQPWRPPRQAPMSLTWMPPKGNGSLGQGKCPFLRSCRCPHPLDRRRLRQICGEGNQARQSLRRNYHGSSVLRKRTQGRDLEN